MAKSDTHRRRALILVENAPITRDRRVLLEARALRDHGFVVSVICPRSGDRGATFEWLDGIGVHWMPLPQNVTGINGYLTEYGAAFWHALRLSVRTLRVPGFDVLQVCNPPDIFFPFALLFRLFGKRFIFDQHDLTPETFKVQFGEGSVRSRWLLRLLYLCERITYRVSDVVMVTNESFRERALRAGVPPERLFVVRNGPNEERLRRVPPDITLKQGRTHLVCYVGLMGYQDGVDIVLRAAERLVHRHGRHDVTFALLGSGDQFPILQALARELRIEAYVVFTGYVESNELMRYLSTADVGLAPDPQNGLNEYLTTIKVMEYIAVGLPVVAFDLKETRRSADDAALYAVPNDIDAFSQHFAALLDDPELRSALGDRGRERVQKHLAWDYSREQLILAYQRAVDRV